MIIYPGGTAFDPNTVGYTFWANHFSDLGMLTAFNGQPNQAGFILFTIAVLITALAPIPAFIALPSLFSDERDKKWIRITSACSIASSTCILIITLFPADISYLLHVLIALLRGFIVLLYAIVGTITFLKIAEPNVFNKKYAILFAALSVAAFLHGLGAFIYQIVETSEMHVFIVSLQKIRNYIDVSCSLALIYGAEKMLKQ